MTLSPATISGAGFDAPTMDLIRYRTRLMPSLFQSSRYLPESRPATPGQEAPHIRSRGDLEALTVPLMAGLKMRGMNPASLTYLSLP